MAPTPYWRFASTRSANKTPSGYKPNTWPPAPATALLALQVAASSCADRLEVRGIATAQSREVMKDMHYVVDPSRAVAWTDQAHDLRPLWVFRP